jgi:hypothetical protein
MKTAPSKESISGLTVIDLLLVLSVLFILAFLLVPRSPRSRGKASRVDCVNNLKQVGLALRMWSNENGEKFPWAVTATNGFGGTLEWAESNQTWRHFRAISNELTSPKIMACPKDTRLRASKWAEITSNKYLSYFAGLDADETRPKTLLSGDRNLKSTVKTTNGILRLTADTPVEWTKEIHNVQGNVCLADGSVQQLTISGVNKQIESALSTQTNRPVIRLALPE